MTPAADETDAARRLLVGVDFSDSALAASRYADELAARLSRSVVRAFVAEHGEETGWPADPVAQRWLTDAGLAAGDVQTRQGLPWVELTRCAVEQRVGLLIVGSHGRTGYHPLSLGGTAERLTIIAPCPVLVVRARARNRPEALAV